MLTNDCLLQVRHLHRGQRGFEAFVSHLQAGAVDGLIQRLASKHAERVGHPSLLCGLPDAACDFIHDDVVVRGIAAQQAAQTDDGIVKFSLRLCPSGRRNFEGPRDADDLDIFGLCSTAQQPVERASQQSLCDELIKSRDDDAETLSVGAEITFKCFELNSSRWRSLFFVVFLRDFVPPC